MLLMLNSFSAFGQQSGYYVIPPAYQGMVTTSMLDSMRAKAASQPKTDINIHYDSLGSLLWFGGDGVKRLVNMPNKVKVTRFACMVNGWVKYETQIDTLSKTKDYTLNTPCYNVLGNDLWTQSITLNVVGSTLIIINSPVNVTAKIYEAYTYKSAIMQFSVIGNGINQSFPVNLESNKSYIVVFINNDNDIVNIKRIGG